MLQHSPHMYWRCLYRGRTEALDLHYAIREGGTIQYYYVLSLYPYLRKYFKFPLGHPRIQVGDACQDTQAMLGKQGHIKCTILHPRRFYHPVLSFRCNNTFLFCLCKTCSFEIKFSDECLQLTVDEWALTITWDLGEVRFELQKGCKVIEIFEV